MSLSPKNAFKQGPVKWIWSVLENPSLCMILVAKPVFFSRIMRGSCENPD
jgi:hypothetical protein